MKWFGRRIVAIAGITLLLGTMLATAGPGLVQIAHADSCGPGNIVFNRWHGYGYFYNRCKISGNAVRLAGVPGSVNTIATFANMVTGDYNMSGNDLQRYTEGAFTIRKMTGQPLPPPFAYHNEAAKSVSQAIINDFLGRLQGYANLGENGSQSFGSNGHVDWWAWLPMNCGDHNSLYQVVERDIAPFVVDTSNTPNCGQPSSYSYFIIFYDNAGNRIFMIRRECMNPYGELQPLSNAPLPNYSMSASISATVNGVASTVAESGDTIAFTYTVQNNGPTGSLPETCSTSSRNYNGYQTPPAAPDGSWGPGYGIGCPGTFNPPPGGGSSATATETFTALSNKTYCRYLSATPAGPGGGVAKDLKCVSVYSKPYFRVYGGDVEAGASFAPSCSAAAPAGGGIIQGFNKGPAGGYAGAGTEVAAFAYGAINEFVSASMRGSAPVPPIGLTFANDNSATYPYGGNFNAGSCIPDYWSLSKSSGATVHTVAPGSWPANPANINADVGPGATIVGNSVQLGAGAKKDIFVDGDAYITSSVIYTGSWTLDMNTNSIPSFRLIAHGNIYIDSSVTQLDGVYVAVPTTADGKTGLIYTCASSAAPPTESYVAASCGQQLRVNGAFIANGVKLLRMVGTLRNAPPLEGAGSGNIGEVFTYSPDVWLANPQFSFPGSEGYDAAAGLLPVL